MIRLFKVSIPNSAVALIISEALLLFFCYVFAGWLTLDVPLLSFLFEQGGYWQIAFVMAVIMTGLYFNDLYEQYRVRSRIQLLQQFCLALGVAFLLQSLLGYAHWGILLPKWMMVAGSLMVLVVLPAWRVFFTSQLALSLGGQKLLFLGASPAVREIVAHIKKKPELGFAAIGYLDNDSESSSELAGTPRLGSLAALDEVIADRQPARIVVGMEPHGLPLEHLLGLRLAGLQIEEASNVYEMIFHRVSTRDLPPAELIFSNAMCPRATSVTIQSATSMLLALLALAVALPAMAVIAIIVKTIFPGQPVFSRQQCVGHNGVLFWRWKFRARREDSTATATWLRKLRFNELPQLFNVLRGEMSIVGPRPERPEFAAMLEETIPFYRQRLCVKPGMIGWAQLHDRTGGVEDTIEKLEYDRYYIKNHSFSLDAYVIFHTLKATLGGR